MSRTPWWDHLTLRSEIADAGGNINDVQTSLYHAVHEPDSVPYSEVGYYSDITHPTAGLLELAARIAVRLGGSQTTSVKPIWRGDQGMGGGKSHAEVGLFHMADDPQAFFATELGEQVLAHAAGIPGGADLPTDLGEPVVAVLPCDKMDPFHPDKQLDNIAETLGQRWLWRAVQGDLSRFHDLKDDLGTPTGIGHILDSVGGRVLTLVDEVLNYIRKATADQANTQRAQEDVAFLRDLMDATNTSSNAAMVVVMISSHDDTVSMATFGETIRREMEDLLTRYARSIATTSGGDFAEIIRRRLFDGPPERDVIGQLVDDYANVASTGGWQTHFDKFDWWTNDFGDEVARCYPFHPALVDLVESEWAPRAGFQKVRSTIQIFAATIHAWVTRAAADEWAPELIGLGDLVLSDNLVRDAVLDSGVITDTKSVTNYREIAENDVVALDDIRGTARQHDVQRTDGLFTSTNPRVSERIATALFVTSLASRAQGETGATDAELRVAAFVPKTSCQLGDVDAAGQLLEDPSKGIATLEVKPGSGGRPRRLLMQTGQTLQMFFRSQRAAVTDDDTDQALRDSTRRQVKAGPFEDARFLDMSHLPSGTTDTDLAAGIADSILNAGFDTAETRLVVLDPSHATLLNGADAACRAALIAAYGLQKPAEWKDADYGGPWPTAHSNSHPSSLVFAVVNTYRRSHAKKAAADMVAWQRVASIPSVSAEAPLKQEAEAKRSEQRDRLDDAVRKAFQHLVYYGLGPDVKSVKADADHMTALDGTVAWKLLVQEQRALESGQFDSIALLHHLRDTDFGRSLKQLFTAYYKTPRLPMLPNGPTDFRNAVHATIVAGDAELRVNGTVAAPTGAADINVTSSATTLHRPAEQPVEPESPGDYQPGGSTLPTMGGEGDGAEGGFTSTPTSGPSSSQSPSLNPEVRLAISKPGTTFNDYPSERTALRQALMRLADAVEEGDVSHLQLGLNVVVDRDVAEEVTGTLPAGYTATVTEI